MKKKRILIIGNAADPHVEPRAEFLAHHGFEVYIFSPPFKKVLDYVSSNIHVIVHQEYGNLYLDLFMRMLKYISVVKQVKPDLVHVFYAVLYNMFVIPFTRVPVIASALGGDLLLDQKYKLTHHIDRRISKRLIKRTDFMTAVSLQLYHILKDEYRIPEKRLLHQRYGFDFRLLSGLSKVDKQQMRQAYDIGQDDVVIFSSRHIEPVYNIETVIEVMKYVAARKKQVKLLLRTYRDSLEARTYFQKIQQKIEEYKLTDCVRYVGYLGYEEYIKVLSISDLMISMSKSDGSPISVLEAMACHKPVVCSNTQANSEIIQHRYNGILLEDNDPEKLSDEIMRILGDQEFTQMLIDNAYNFVSEHADFEKEMAKMVTIYTELIQNSRS